MAVPLARQLRLANTHFKAVADRRPAPQAAGMLTATEPAVPGRTDRRLDVWRRLGLDDRDLRHLREHVTIDIGHARGRLDNMVAPIAGERPDLLPETAIGVLRRLDRALAVRERAWKEFRPQA
ncbi:iron-containing redox enzyme family protein [Actinomadura graeca]|uniref:Iron-containing redox enzyme family protein n=1 Tax=Actinomadura graeca TaxID=2750812 RepID=A0ABX8QW94_9ACTN|nr:iron-containing redox enzyme family protein [Actinomadura graeca]QXJ23106.1 iron-containing redox enzyme family protein [Actinomadura graeca]